MNPVSLPISIQVGKQAVTQPPPTVRRLPPGRKFGWIKSDFALYGLSRPSYKGDGPAVLGLPQTVKVLEPVGVPLTRPWQMYWADLFSLQHYQKLYPGLTRAEKAVINNALLGATVGWRAVTNKHGWDNGYAEYWTNQNSGAQPMQQETINFGCNVVELVTGKIERKGGKDVYRVYTLNGEEHPPDATKVNQFLTPWLVPYGNISRREKILDPRTQKWTGRWTENIVIHWPQLPSGVPIPFMGKWDQNFIISDRIKILPDNAPVPDPLKP